MSEALISVVLPVKNGMPFLKESIESILKQIEKRFKLIIIDDHSNDGSVEYIKSLNDDRIILHKNSGSGLVDALNLGLSLADTEFIARMDADDISLPERFERQLELFQKDSKIVLAGTLYSYFSTSVTRVVKNKLPINNDDILFKMNNVENAICHATIMMKREMIAKIGFYDKDSYPAEDYDLFYRASSNGKLANVPQYLYKVRITQNSIFSVNAVKSIKMYTYVRNKYVTNETGKRKLRILPYSINIYRKGLYYYLNYKWIRAVYYLVLAFILSPGRGMNFIFRNIFKNRN